MSLLYWSLSAIRRSLSSYQDPSPELIPILREILYSAEDPRAIELSLEILQLLCCRCPDNKWILCERGDILSQLLWILREKSNETPHIYISAVILVQLCEKQLGRENVKARLVENSSHVVGGLESNDSWYIALHTIAYMIREDEHALQVFDTPIPGEMDFIDLMVIWLYNLYIHLANGGARYDGVIGGITLLLLILSRCASFPSLRGRVADSLCRERVTDRHGVSLFVPALIVDYKIFNRKNKCAAMNLIRAIANERPLLNGSLGPYCNLLNKMRLSNWNLDRYQRTMDFIAKAKRVHMV